MRTLLISCLAISLWSTAGAVKPWQRPPSPAALTQAEMRDQLLQNCLEYEAAMKRGDRLRARQEQFEIQRNLDELNEMVEQHYLQTPRRSERAGMSRRMIVTHPSRVRVPMEAARDSDPDTGTYYYLRTK